MKKIGHRGAPGYEPENTLKSFKKAIELNVDMIELDVHLCKTKELVVIHDFTLNRTTNGKGPISKKSFSEVRKLDAGKKEKIPLLEEVLDLVNQRVGVNIELKGKNTVKPVSELINKYIRTKGWSLNKFLISSSNLNEIKKFHNLNPKIKIGICLTKIPKDFIKIFKNLGLYSLHFCGKHITKKIIKESQDNGLKIYVWTLNKPKDIKKAKELGINGIFSDFPDRL